MATATRPFSIDDLHRFFAAAHETVGSGDHPPSESDREVAASESRGSEE